MDRIDAILEHSEATPAPLTAEMIMSRLANMRSRSLAHYDQVHASSSSSDVSAENQEKETQQKDVEALKLLKYLERHPRLHSLSPQLNPSQTAMLNEILDEMTALKPFDEKPVNPTIPVDFLPNAPTQTQIEGLISKKHALEEMLQPFAEAGMQRMPFDLLSTPRPTSSRSSRVGKKTKF